MALKNDAKFEEKYLKIFVFSKVTWRICQIFVHRLENSNFILESKMIDQIDQMLSENFILPLK